MTCMTNLIKIDPSFMKFKKSCDILEIIPTVLSVVTVCFLVLPGQQGMHWA